MAALVNLCRSLQTPSAFINALPTLRSAILGVKCVGDLGAVFDANNQRCTLDALWIANLRRITTISLLETNAVSVCAFVLPCGASLPLHDHPMMTVMGTVLEGALRVEAYDWVDEENQVAVKLSPSTVQRHGSFFFNTTGGGCIHHLSSSDRCTIFLDVISPPYHAPPSFARCTYYKPARDALVGEHVRLLVYHPAIVMDGLVSVIYCEVLIKKSFFLISSCEEYVRIQLDR